MAYGDITNSPHIANSQYREKNGVETVDRAVVLKDASTKGGPAINYLSNTLNLGQLNFVKASNRAALYVGVQGDVCVLLSGQSAPISTGTANENATNKLKVSTADFTVDGVQVRDIAVNTTDSTAAFIGVIDNSTTLSLVDISNSSVDVFPDGDETFEIYRAVLFQNVQAGTLLPIQVDRVFALGTTADDIIAIY
tara:strand:+ start:962 stop:1546 length:585 start_codon:yes stop_codon:yes gene_type:complete